MDLPSWFTASFLKLSEEDKQIILDFCNCFKLFCECKTKPMMYSKYCFLCFNILRNSEESEVEIRKNETISVKSILMYQKFCMKKENKQ